MKINSEVLNQRAFILSSFRRLEIPISISVYKFVDKIIGEGWMPPLSSVNKVDQFIKNKYKEFINE
jgi:hypothetical protein